MNPHFEALEFPRILEQLKENALSEKAKQELGSLSPILSEDVCRRKMAETTAARAVLEGCGSPPLVPMKGLEEIIGLAGAGAMLLPEQLTTVARFAAACRRLAAYLKRGEAFGAEIAAYGRGFSDLSALRQEIESAVSDEKVYDEASPVLRGLRRKIERLETQIKEKLNHILQSRKQYLADNYVSIRRGHHVLPVQRRYQSQFGGTVIDVSGKGTTVFMEPSSITAMQEERSGLSVEEDCETRRVLYTLTARVAEEASRLRADAELMEALDLLFAKAKYSAQIGARPVEIGGERKIRIVGGWHPLLDRERCVPLDFTMEAGTVGVVITGPNTGGKTVALKTVGLLTLMAQCGLHVPCGEGSYFAMQDGFWCDIGDSQDISQNLSTFSGHITNVIGILNGASRDSLVLLDELGSGTDPAEGMGIAVAVLEELRRRECMFLVTTHYPQVKRYAEEAQGVQTARMAFDRESLRPLYRLELGKSGESCALYIAERLGLPPQLLRRAHREVYGGEENGAAREERMRVPKSRLVRTAPLRQGPDPSEKFSMGDSVELLATGETGIVYRPADDLGDVVVQIKGTKRRIRHNRLRLRVPAAELYPPDYDFSIIFDTVENRKARHTMERKFDPDAVITYEPEEA